MEKVVFICLDLYEILACTLLRTFLRVLYNNPQDFHISYRFLKSGTNFYILFDENSKYNIVECRFFSHFTDIYHYIKIKEKKNRIFFYFLTFFKNKI